MDLSAGRFGVNLVTACPRRLTIPARIFGTLIRCRQTCGTGRDRNYAVVVRIVGYLLLILRSCRGRRVIYVKHLGRACVMRALKRCVVPICLTSVNVRLLALT